MRTSKPFASWIRRAFITLFAVYVVMLIVDLASILAGRGRMVAYAQELYAALFVVLVILRFAMHRYRHSYPASGRGGEVAFSSRTSSPGGFSNWSIPRR